MEIRLAKAEDIKGWMRLVEQVKDSFPGLDTAEQLKQHEQTVLEFISRGEAVCAVENGETAGALLFSKQNSMLCFLAVSGSFRRRGTAKKLVEFMLERIPTENDVTVTTYREGAPGGEPARAFYRRMGFCEGRLLEEFGSPVQEFILKRS